MVEEGAVRRGMDVLSALEEAEGTAVLLSEKEWRARVKGATAAPSRAGKPVGIPPFARERDPLAAFRRFVEPLRKRNYRIVLAGPDGQVLRLWRRRVERSLRGRLISVQDWEAVRAASPDQPSLLTGPVEQGFLDHEEKIACIALRDLAGQAAGPRNRGFAASRLIDTQLRFGDVVVHIEYGLGVLEGLEITGDGDGEAEVLRLRYADDAVLLVPLRDIGLIWRLTG